MYPPVLPYVEGIPPPPGYRLQQDAAARNIAIAGAIVFSLAYSVPIAMFGPMVPEFLVPLAGPFIVTGEGADSLTPFSLAMGSAQVLGVTMIVIGLARRRRPHYVRADLAGRRPPPPGLALLEL